MTSATIVLVSTGVIVVIAGVILGRAADKIAELTGVGGMWTGWLLLAAATSLPEFVTDISAVRVHAADIGAGDLFGSSLANMAILAVIAFACAPPQRANHSGATNLSACLAIALNLLGAVFTLLHYGLAVAGVSLEALLIVVFYVGGTRLLYGRTRNGSKTNQLQTDRAGSGRLAFPAVAFAIGAAMIFAAAPQYAKSAKQFAALSGLGESLVGTWLLGFSTALPELVTSLTAARMGAFDLAVANLYGSCAFNMVVFFAMDIASPAPIFSSLNPQLALAGFLAALLMAFGLIAINYRRQHALAMYTRGGLLLACYGLAIWVLYRWR
jgi:cation:H+ antiporter